MVAIAAPPASGIARESQFDCFLADQPGYLAPERLLRQASAPAGEGLRVNPRAWFSWRGPPPPAIARLLPLSDRFLADAGFVWVEDSARATQTPFWAGPWFQKRLDALWNGEAVAGLSAHHRAALQLAQVLTSAEEDARAAAAWRSSLETAARRFRAEGWAPLAGIIHPFHIDSLRRYYRGLLRRGGMTLGDSGSPLRYVAHNESVARFFHSQIASAVGAIAGAPVKPSYVYVSSYQGGADLPAHTDRAQCEYSVSLLLDYTPEPVDRSSWPLYLVTASGPVAIWQGIGDGLIYRGRELVHYRTKLPETMTSTSIFFHYVDRDFRGSLD